ncbi:serine hydrolase domain-containing protein [Chitinophaga solisilvae]|uniref:serine hydrolase domain-containing protein n=1 Tax=Chitinophaga solisilvae TaxID=1233460 RepID=UPI0013694F1B|nr:serine hydrolase domain-containing protein [Chitinophaga solisilvae]
MARYHSSYPCLKVIQTVITMLLLPAGVFAQALQDSLTIKLEEQFQHSAFPGFVTAIVNADTILYERAFGYADIENKKPYTLQTLQPVASVSKLLIGMAVMKATDQQLLTPGTEINSILPFTVTHPGQPQVPVTVLHLATHTSGIRDNPDMYRKTYFFYPPEPAGNPVYQYMKAKGYGAALPPADTTLAGFLRDYLSPRGAFYHRSNFGKYAPGKAYSYSNIGADLAALLVEYKAGESFAAYTKKNIFLPLGMKHTSWTRDLADIALYAALYTGSRQRYPAYGSVCYPDGGLITSGHELALLLKENISGYFGKSAVLSPAACATLMQPVFSADNTPRDTDPANPNSGIFYAIKKSGIIGHTGGDGGVSSFFYFNPAKKFGMLLLTNTEIEGADGINKQVLEDFEKVWRVLGQYGEQLQRGYQGERR